MFSKEESKKLRQEFWTFFGKSYPKKWILYDTKIKDLSFKFHFDTKNAAVSLDIESHDLEKRITYYEKIVALKTIILDEYLRDAIFEDSCLLDNGKEISRVFVSLNQVSIHNKNTWHQAMEFLAEHMQKFEDFWEVYEDFVKA